jgi:hypothetical protein
MYKIRGADDKEYGPVSVEQIHQWLAEGRLNGRTPVREESSTEWRLLSDVPELKPQWAAGPPVMTPPGVAGIAAPTGYPPRSGLAITSFILGLLSLVCLSVFGGIPAIVLGHIAHSRARRLPAVYGGSGFAIAGFITGYLSLAFAVLIMPAMLLPALAKAKGRAQSINCVNNLKQVGLAFRVWSLDNKDEFPFNVSTNAGGTMEFCAVGTDGFDANAVLHFRALSNELGTAKILVCPADSKVAGSNFRFLSAGNISYQLHTGTNFTEANPGAVLVVCPIHGHTLLCDGSVIQGKRLR